jgi:miniconductance mechanosensitive channel
MELSGLFLTTSLSAITKWDDILKEWMEKIGLSEGWFSFLANLCWTIALLILCWIIYHLAVKIINISLSKVQNSKVQTLKRKKVFKRLCLILPLVIINATYTELWSDYPTLLKWLDKLLGITYIVNFILILSAIGNAVVDIYQYAETGKQKPIKSLVQFVEIIVYFVSAIIAISILYGVAPGGLLTGLGAVSAVLMLIFKDSILGLVSGIQLSLNNMVAIGDWIVLPKYSTDGDVIDITLTTVKVQNWDNTISTIPTYVLTSDVVINWRGMSESGGRRISRSINIDMKSIKFCSLEMLEKFKKIALVKDYIEKTEEEQAVYNNEHNIDVSITGNGRQQTNIGVFRAYMTAYLKSLPTLNKDMTLMVRQMPPTETGLPLQVYCFTATTQWVPYEQIQSDIFDHFLGILPYFELSVYQNISEISQ